MEDFEMRQMTELSDTTQKIVIFIGAGLIFIPLDVACMRYFHIRDAFWSTVLLTFALAQISTLLVTKAMKMRAAQRQ
ncbi:hypothetical protein [Acetobacter persici]|nr:hypothetical protein [Acetobacter persici]